MFQFQKPEINFQRTPVTLIVAAIVVALEVVCTLDELPGAPGGSRRFAYYNDYLGILPRLWAGELWRPFTSTLMHGGLIHAAFNVYWLMIFGPPLENRFGSYRFCGLIVLLGYASMMPEYVIGSYRRVNPIMIVGLSGVVYGLFGVVFVGRRRHAYLRAVCDDATVKLLLGWFFLCILLTYAGLMPVANIAHGAGFVFGVLYGMAVFDVANRLRWTLASVAATLLVAATLVVCPGHNAYEHIKRTGRLWWRGPFSRTIEAPDFSPTCASFGRRPFSP